LPFCSKCGAEYPDDASFCPKCGAPVQSTGVVYRKEPQRGGAGRIISIIFGGFVLLIAFGFITGGGALLWSQTALTDSSGYLMAPSERFNVASYAVVEDNIDIQMSRGWMMNPTADDIVSLKLTVTPNNGKPVFVGIAQRQYAEDYLTGVNIDRLVSYTWMHSTMMDDDTPVFQTISGGAPSTPPAAQSFWVAQSSGTGTQTVTWTPTNGEYWVVVMNADGSKAVDVNAQVGARITVLSWVGWGLLIGGLTIAAIGVAAIYFGAIRRP
jgi:hypothetical protein